MIATALCFLAGLTAKAQQEHPPLPSLPREFRGAWVATVANIDWPSQRGISTAVARKELHEIVLTAARLHLNALLLQVRPSADALYKSSLEPWSEFLTGKQGQAPNPAWDPLAEAIHDAHEHGIELHAWFNPYRAQSPAQHGPNHHSHVAIAHPDWVKRYGPFLWIDPGVEEARKHSLAVFLDVVKRYDVDGIVIDDYFYPYKEKGADNKILDFPDDESWEHYQDHGGKLSRDDWRRDNVNKLIREVYEGIKKEKPWVKFGISPFGIYRPGNPAGIKAGVDQYADLYADAKLWLQSGWCDYISPQLYWPLAQKAQAYGPLLGWWELANTKDRYVWPSNNDEALTRKGPGEILNQVADTRERGANGNVHFSFKILQKDVAGLADKLIDGPYKHEAAVPSCPWLARGAMPKAEFVDGKLKTNEETRWIFFSQLVDGKWTPWAKERPGGTGLAVIPVDRYGRAGKAVFEEEN